VPTSKRRRRWIIGVLVLVVVIVAGLVTAAQLISVKKVEVVGTVNQDPGQVSTASGIEPGDRMAGIDTSSAASMVSQLPWVNSVTVSRSWPSTITISVAEHTPVGLLDDNGTSVVIDAQGQQFLRDAAPDGVVKIRASASDKAAVTAAAHLLNALIPLGSDFRAGLAEVDAPAADRLTLKLNDGREVFWGSDERSEEKAEATKIVLGREGTRWNVSNPAIPAVRN